MAVKMSISSVKEWELLQQFILILREESVKNLLVRKINLNPK